MLIVTLTLVFLGTLALVAGGALFVDRKRLTASRTVRERLAAPLPGELGTERTVRLVRGEDRLSGFEFLQQALARWERTEHLADRLRRAGLTTTVGEFVLMVAVAAAGGLAVGTFVIGLAVGLVLGAVAVGAPWLVLAQLTKRRMARFEAQLPEAIDAIVNSLKAGYSFPAALEFASGEVPGPLGPELARVRDEQRLGVEARPSLLGFADRVGTPDARMLVTAVLVQRDTGGNLAELLGDLAQLVRDRTAFRGRVAALTAEPRMSALVLALLPVGLFIVMMCFNRSYMEPMVTTPLGRLMLTAAALFSVGGYLFMRKLGDVEL